MSFNYEFKYAESKKEIDGVVSFILTQPLGYPNFEDWVERSRQELLYGNKRAIVAFSDGFLVGDAIFQPHKGTFGDSKQNDLPSFGFTELKNVRVHPKLRKRYFGAFMIRQVEAESQNENMGGVIVDTRSDRRDIISMLRQSGYKEIARAPLYDESAEDVIFVKRWEMNDEGFYVSERN